MSTNLFRFWLVMLQVFVFVALLSLTSCFPSNSTNSSTTTCLQCSYHGICSANATCVCLPNWSGSNCSNFTDPCSNPQSPLCANNATCIAKNIPSVFAQQNSSANYSASRLLNFSWTSSHQCNCSSSSHSGDRCELEYCDRAQCYNHGECLWDTTANNTLCNCNSQYNGTRCRDCIVCSAGFSPPCTTINCNHGFCEISNNSYECTCSSGFTGVDCSTDVNECSMEPGICNFGNCVNDIGSYHCECTNSGYQGSECNQELFECASQPCKNGGTCTEVSGAGYKCVCSGGWSGSTCETHICDYGGTCVHGVCAVSPPPFTCSCQSGYEGDNCDIELDECETVTCQNGGTCEDMVNGYSCLCSQGYEGTHCESEIDYCLSNTCSHGSCVSLLTNYSCSCDAGYTGEFCEEDIDDCSPNPCINGSCIDGENNFTCQCLMGYTGITCNEDIDDCSADLCGVHGNCTDLLNNFTCSCDVGYAGEVCDALIDYCSVVNCSNHGSCAASNCTGLSCGTYTDFFSCTCDTGYTGTLCQEVVLHCPNNNCSNGECIEEVAGYSCKCEDGFSGYFCSVNESSCVDNSCENGTCVDYYPKYSCECYAGFEGELCDTKIDWCENVTCLNGTCREDNITASCECYLGYYGDLCQYRNACFNHSCINGNCSQINSSAYSCVCQEEFSGLYCENTIHSCEYKKCKHNATCTETGNKGMCICTSGYTGELCDVKLPECSSSPCMNHGMCTELQGGYNCTCPVGYSGERCETALSYCPTHLCNSTSGLSCALLNPSNSSCYCSNNVTVNSCEGSSSLCSPNACANNGVCAVYGDSTECICTKNYTGETCQYLTDPCSSQPCNQGNCVTSSQGEFECDCMDTATGRYCESMVLPCNETEICSIPGSERCLRNSTQEICYCYPAFSGDDCSNQLECPDNLCLHASCCVAVGGSFECSQHPNCSPHVCDSKPCIHGNCSAIGVNYTCDCTVGFTGQHCDAPIDFCSQIDCANGGTCENGADSPVCSCKHNYYGQLCLFESPESDYLFEDCVNNSCRYVFNNGVCDTNCAAKESCLYDGLDCLEPLTCPSSDCEFIYGNEACNNQCNNESCLFDGGDCLPDYISYKQEFASGSLLITVKSPSTSYSFTMHSLPQLLFRISKILRTIVVLEYVSELDRTYSRVSRSTEGDYEYKYKISSRIENSLCRDYCFRTTRMAADCLNAYLMDTSIDTSEYSVLQITGSDESSQWDEWPIVAGVSFATIALLLLIGIGGVIIGKKRARSMYFPRRAGTTSSERAALVGSRTDTEDPDSIGIKFSNSTNEYAAKRVKLNSSISSSTRISSDSRPPPYEYFQQSLPQGYLSNPIFPPMRQHNTKSFPLSSIELDQLLVTSSPAAYSPSTSVSPESINAKGIGGYTPISLAVITGKPTVCGFLPFPALPSSHPAPCNSSSDQLSVEDLISLGADVNIPNDRGATPLHLAAMYACSDMAGSLIAAGAKVNAQDSLGRTPLHSAVTSGAKGVFHILLTNRNLNIDQQSLDGSTALMLGTTHLNNDFVHEMLRADASANIVDKTGCTALHWAGAVNNAAAIQTLLTHSADIDYPNCRGETPIFVAAKEGSTDSLLALLQNSANSQITDLFERSPLAVASERLHTDIEHILTSQTPTCGQNTGYTPKPVGIRSKVSPNSKSTPNSSATKTPNKKVKKFTPPGSKVHPLTPTPPIDSPLSPRVQVKLEIPSPLLSSPMHTPVIPITPLLPLSTDYSDQIQDFDTSPTISKFHLARTHPHPYPTPPNIHSDFLKPPQQTLLSEAPFSSHYPSPESSHYTVSPPNISPLNAMSTNASYPSHFPNENYASCNPRHTPAEPDWDEFNCS